MSEPVPGLPPMTCDEFLAWEDGVDERHEFVDGVVYAMTGASLPHNRIALNVAARLLAEVLSPGTARHDRGRKLAKYRGLRSLRAYPIVGQESRHVERRWRESADAPWRREEITADVGRVPVPCPVPGALEFDDVYRLTALPDRPPLRRVREAPAGAFAPVPNAMA